MGFGRGWGALLAIFSIFFRFVTISYKKLIFDALGRGLGRVLGGSGEGFGKVLGGSGNLLGAVGSSQGCSVPFFVIFCVFCVVSRSLLFFVVFGCFLRYFWLFCSVSAVVLCCAGLCCAVCCAVLGCAVLCCAVLCCAVLCCAVLCCAVLCCVVLCCFVLG